MRPVLSDKALRGAPESFLQLVCLSTLHGRFAAMLQQRHFKTLHNHSDPWIP